MVLQVDLQAIALIMVAAGLLGNLAGALMTLMRPVGDSPPGGKINNPIS